jgi:hypothetical protein
VLGDEEIDYETLFSPKLVFEFKEETNSILYLRFRFYIISSCLPFSIQKVAILCGA